MGGMKNRAGLPAHPASPAFPALLLFCVLCLGGAARMQGTPAWGLDRIDQQALPLDRRFNPGADGAGVHVYIVDTGVRRTHREFEGRVDWIGDFTTGTGASPSVKDADD